ncbi:hypothetical protein [Streptomyces sp. AC495_CC817]|uniref:hypothetical protein n=1 Tax=Streptomyces sp. AC495_CC817 TaxID=2823900 RepID=UPI001C26C243|nr:hypothetical protein [Streptomyces sp. AC495_CC817]
MTAVFSRRSALGAGAVALGVGLVAGGRTAASATTGDGGAVASSAASSGAAGVRTSASDPLLPTRSLFAGEEGRDYVGVSPWAQRRLVLERVEDLAGEGDPEHRFAVSFRAEESARDGIYRLVREGELVASLFLVRAGGGTSLEAVIDRGSAA